MELTTTLSPVIDLTGVQIDGHINENAETALLKARTSKTVKIAIERIGTEGSTPIPVRYVEAIEDAVFDMVSDPIRFSLLRKIYLIMNS